MLRVLAGDPAEVPSIVARYARAGMLERRRRVPRFRWPRLLEVEYGTALAQIVDVRDELAPLLAELPRLLDASARARAERRDEGESRRATDLLDVARRELDRSLSTYQLDAVARSMGKRVSDHQRAELSRQVQAAIGIDLVASEAGIERLISEFATQNVALIKSLGNKTLDDVAKIVSRAFVTGQRAEDVAGEIAERYAISERHARLIARDQIGTLNGQVAAARHQNLGIGSFRWSSMNDPKVRPKHRHLNNKVFAYSALPSEGLPGEPIMCRCYQEPVFDELQEVAIANAPKRAARPRRPKPAPSPPAPSPVPPVAPGAAPAPPPVTAAEQYRAAVEKDLLARLRYQRSSGLVFDDHEIGTIQPGDNGTFRAMDRVAGARPMEIGVFASEQEAVEALRAAAQERIAAAAEQIKKFDQAAYLEAVAREDGAEMRAQVRGLLWENGVLPRDAVLSARAAELGILPDRALPEARAVHQSDGFVMLRRSVLDEAKDSGKFFDHLSTMVHEELHGATPAMVMAFYRGAGAAIEEATVEMAARLIVLEARGLPSAALALSVRSYQRVIDSLSRIIAEEAGTLYAMRQIAEAGVAMRSRIRRVKAIYSESDIIDSFLDGLDVPSAAKPKIRARILSEMERI